VGSWQSQSANIGRNCLPWQPTLAAQLLENGAKIEPYTIIIMMTTNMYTKLASIEINDEILSKVVGIRKNWAQKDSVFTTFF
jgi:hypothetical protein